MSGFVGFTALRVFYWLGYAEARCPVAPRALQNQEISYVYFFISVESFIRQD
jgi:hypothetical protein